MLKLFPWILFAAALVVIGLMKSCQPAVEPVVKTVIKYIRVTDTVHDSKLVPYAVYKKGKSQVITIHDTSIISEFIPVDTFAILDDYFETRLYKHTLHHKFGDIVLEDTVSQNKLVGTGAIFNFNVPEVTKTTEPNKRKGFMGFDVGLGNQLAMGGIQFIYIDKKDNEFHLRTDFTTLGSFYVAGGVGWKITFHKK